MARAAIRSPPTMIGSGPGPEPPDEACRSLARPTVGSVVTLTPGNEVEVADGRVEVDVEVAVDAVVVDGFVEDAPPEGATDPCWPWAWVAVCAWPRPPPPPPLPPLPPAPPDPPAGTVVGGEVLQMAL
jgi:hypothetical protein